MTELENLKKKLLYRSNYRGTKEMDILLSKFVKKYINQLDKESLYDLEYLLDLNDEVLSNFYINSISSKGIKNNLIFKLFKEFKYN